MASIQEIHHLEQNDTNSVFSARNDIVFALETKEGWFTRHNIAPGTVITSEKGSLAETFSCAASEIIFRPRARRSLSFKSASAGRPVDAVGQLAILEKQHRRDRLHLKILRQPRRLVHVDLDKLDLVREPAGHARPACGENCRHGPHHVA